MQYTDQNQRAPGHPVGESRQSPLRVDFDRRLKSEFHGSKITPDGGFHAYRELDDALGPSEVAMPRNLFEKILGLKILGLKIMGLIDDRCRRPVPA